MVSPFRSSPLPRKHDGRKKRRTRTMMPQKMHLTRAKFTQILRRRRPCGRGRDATDTSDGEPICVPIQSVEKWDGHARGDHRNRRLQSFIHEARSYSCAPPSPRAIATICKKESYFSSLRSKVSLTLEREVSTQFVRRPLAPGGCAAAAVARFPVSSLLSRASPAHCTPISASDRSL